MTGGGHNLYLILPVAIFYRKDPIAVLFFFCSNICADPEFCHRSGTYATPRFVVGVLLHAEPLHTKLNHMHANETRPCGIKRDQI